MRLIVTTESDMAVFKNLLAINIASKIPGAFIIDYVDASGIKSFKFANSVIQIECQLIPEYKREYSTIENSRADDLIDDIQELIREYKERQ